MMPTTASRRHVRSRTSRSAACARPRDSSPPPSSSRRRRRRPTSRSGVSTPASASAIIQAADEILNGALRDQFIVDVYQAGAGTSHNMNVNEVLANRAVEILGGAKGEYRLVHPNDHVNMGQSTNDVFPTATRLALLLGARVRWWTRRARWRRRLRARPTSSRRCSRSAARICRTRCR